MKMQTSLRHDATPPPPPWLPSIGWLLIGPMLLLASGCANISARQAAASGNLPALQAAIAKGADLNKSEGTEGTPLHQAVLSQREDIARWCLENGARPDVVNETGETPLHIAADHGYTDMVKLLLNNGANPNAKRKDGSTPLHFSAAWNRVEAAQLLLAKGAQVDTQYGEGITPLHLFIENAFLVEKLPGLSPMTILLLDAGAKPAEIKRKAWNIRTLELMSAGSFFVYGLYLERKGQPAEAIPHYQKAAHIYDTIPKRLTVRVNVRADPKETAAKAAALESFQFMLLSTGNASQFGALAGAAPFLMQPGVVKDLPTRAKELADLCRKRIQELGQQTAGGSPAAK